MGASSALSLRSSLRTQAGYARRRVPFSFEAIGVFRSPFDERSAAPRQAVVARDVEGRIELEAGRGYEDALDGLGSWDYAWVVFVFHKNLEQGRGWRPKVQPPRSDAKRGLFATRSPHRPNPIGISAVRIVRVDGLFVHVRNVDILDGTPVLDIKPYVAYADAYPGAGSGWLDGGEPERSWRVDWSDDARAQLDWLAARGVDLRVPIESALSLGPQPHAYRRIRRSAGGMRLAVKEWRADFTIDETRRTVNLLRLSSGYRPSEITQQDTLSLHRAFAALWG
ncbi:MAG TPA: tRNA (N6-threonylcarbamoyladenosine(37)-N6)-methyltransferase TrmO [Polyangiaceae bacterium]|nr:tRNA (N6-threonylcarbamoyladenosine(37)-N6)-methyltransferase TrmO [Polyangiaceae bacterium]